MAIARRAIEGEPGGVTPPGTLDERLAKRDPRLSLEERYGTHDGYVAVVRKAVEQAVADRFLLPDDAARLLRAAETSAVLVPQSVASPSASPSSSCAPKTARASVDATAASPPLCLVTLAEREQSDRHVGMSNRFP